ncbi:class I SAM-dependent methyltransferase [Botrimarina mediterranea]|uniref:Methyltransferase small domain protein n=1 Tax=Botrimarina mediterranea TaxID=2528022 RepID=A0A518KC79_9BACT|nr:class I SAM-dependent methyltransferase [Botrimarina mediterranea]QDV75406.1 Methyltransferase small domain protein [Botrimarina mediterranea]
MTPQNPTNPAHRRLLALRAENEAAREDMAAQAPRFRHLAEPGAAPRVIVSDNLFQTPPVIAELMVKLLAPRAGWRVLEPSVGLGRLVTALHGYNVEVTAVDVSQECCDEVLHLRWIPGRLTVCREDFLTVPVTRWPAFDAVLMNPPFRRGADIKHTRHALAMLKPGGRLVGLCYGGTRQEAALRPLAATWRRLPAASFASEGTRADVVLFSIG